MKRQRENEGKRTEGVSGRGLKGSLGRGSVFRSVRGVLEGELKVEREK